MMKSGNVWMVFPFNDLLIGELALFKREAVDGNRVTGVMRAFIEEDLNVTYVIKTGLV